MRRHRLPRRLLSRARCRRSKVLTHTCRCDSAARQRGPEEERLGQRVITFEQGYSAPSLDVFALLRSVSAGRTAKDCAPVSIPLDPDADDGTVHHHATLTAAELLCEPA